MTYPLPVYREEAEIGNPGFARYRYRVTWKGDTVVRMEPTGEERKRGYSDFDKGQVPIFYGREGPCPLYQRDEMMSPEKPKPAELFLDSSPIDFWNLKGNNRR